MGKQIKDFPQKSTPDGNDLLLLQDATTQAYNCIAYSQLGLGSGGGNGSSLASWQLKSASYTASSGDRILVDSTNTWTLTLPNSGEVELIKVKGSNALSVTLTAPYQNKLLSGLKLNTNFEKVSLIYVNSAIGWIASRQSLFVGELSPAQYWRISNKNIATGDTNIGSQWIIRELIFRDPSGTDITNGGAGVNVLQPSSAGNAFDKNTGTFTTVTDRTHLYGALQYTFASSVSVSSISLSNLNNGYNVPPTSYSVENSLDGNIWFEAWSFQCGTNDTAYYDSSPLT